jgi:hypothetical protein
VPSWIFAVGDPAPTLAPSRELAEATGRRLTFRLDAACDAQFSWTGEAAPWATDHEARSIVPLAKDLQVWRDGDRLFRGRLASRSGQCGADQYTVQWTALDYRNMLNHRQIGSAGRTFSSATAQSTIAITLIDESEALSGGAWGVDLGTNSGTDTTRTLTLDPGQPLGDAIASQGRLDAGYEWAIEPDSTGDLKLNVWHASVKRGADNGVVLDYGGLVTAFTDLTDPDQFANSVLVTGDMNLTPVTAVTAGIGTDPRGRWERSFGFPTISEQATLTARGPYVLDQSSVLRPEYVVELTAGYWQGRSHVWLGDIVLLVIRVADLDVVADHRVVEVGITISDEGDETVTLGLLSVA